MNDFTFVSPTQIVFGAGKENDVGRLVRSHGGSKVLLHHAGGHAVKSGLIDRVKGSLKAEMVDFVELAGVVPNPRLSKVREGIELYKKENCNFILAVGGGSVIDSAKAIAMGAPYEGDVWDFFMEDNSIPRAVPQKSSPIGVVLTIAATGSEVSNSCVITDEEHNLKRACNTDINRPRFAVENPELMMSLPKFQTASGLVDIMSHSMERYFVPREENGRNELTDRLCEAIFHTCLTCSKVLMDDPHNYDARASVMLTSSISHNNITGVGRTQDWAPHYMEHELAGDYDVTHGAGLAVMIPAWMKYVYRYNPEIFVQWATRVMNVDKAGKTDEEIIREGIENLEAWYKSMGLAVRISDMPEMKGSIGEQDMRRMAERVRKTNPDGSIGGLKHLFAEDIVAIYKLAL